MKEERMKVLKMVEDGKISVEEAVKLLEALSLTGCEGCVDENAFCDNVKGFCDDAEGFLKSLGGKVADFYRDMEPKLRNVTKTAITKTADIVDELGKALSECLNSIGAVCEPHCECCEEEKKEDEIKEEENREN